jgi:hypothetical protein
MVLRFWNGRLDLKGIEPCWTSGLIEAPCPALVTLKRDRESSKCKEVIQFYCSSLANPVRLRRTTGNALAGAFSATEFSIPGIKRTRFRGRVVHVSQSGAEVNPGDMSIQVSVFYFSLTSETQKCGKSLLTIDIFLPIFHAFSGTLSS